MRNIKYLYLFGVFIISGCVKPPPDNIDNICKIFNQYPRWYLDTLDVQQRWHLPIATQMAIIHQESKFDGRARPKRTYIFGFIPWTRPSSAYGYAQALNSTWSDYKKSTGGFRPVREDFADGVDFIGWYTNLANQRAGISRKDPYALYLAYHEGIGGFQRKTYLRKPWLIKVARKVKARSQLYQAQLNYCESNIKKKIWYRSLFGLN